jgi:DNA-binding transcriptional ArsR family regulator
MRRYWTDTERQHLQRLYPNHTVTVIARRLGRSPKAIYQEADKLGLSKVIRTPTGLAFRAELRRLNGLGYSDTEIAESIGCERHTISKWRQRLNLPSNARGDRYKARVRVKTAEQCRKAGVSTLGAVRALAFRKRAAEAGWPADLRPRAVEMLEALSARGPLTRREIAEAIGMPWKGSRWSLKSNDPEGSYLAHLMAQGLVISLGRLVRQGGKGRNCHLYSLALDAGRSFDGVA